MGIDSWARRARDSRAGPALFRVGVGSQLAVARRLDARRRRPGARRDVVARRLTMAMKTFERPAIARRATDSTRAVFDGRIVVSDDSARPARDLGPDVDILRLPFNSGVPHGRNAALAAVDTEFVWVADDDLVFTGASDPGPAVAYLDTHPEVDLVAMLRVDLPHRYALDYGPNQLFPGALPPLREQDEVIGGLPVRLKTAQAYVARTASVAAVGWDERLRMVDHTDFFSRASGRIVCVLDREFICYHARTPFDPGYSRYRNDTAADLALLGRIWHTRATDT